MFLSYSLSLSCLTINILIFTFTAVWGQWAVPAYFQSKRILHFGFAGQSSSIILKLHSVLLSRCYMVCPAVYVVGGISSTWYGEPGSECVLSCIAL